MTSEETKSHQKAQIVFSMLYITLLIMAFILSEKIIDIFNHLSTAAALILPLWFLLSDMIAELFGYNFTKRLFWYAMICLLLFSIFTALLVQIPGPSHWSYQAYYQFVLGKMFIFFCIGFLAFMVANFTNTYLIARSRILFKGRFFWIRSLLSSTIGEAIYSIIACLLVFGITFISPLKQVSLNVAIAIAFNVYLTKLVYTILFSYPLSLITRIVKSKLKIDSSEYVQSFNPFKF